MPAQHTLEQLLSSSRKDDVLPWLPITMQLFASEEAIEATNQVPGKSIY